VTLIGRHRRSEIRMFRALARSSTPPLSITETDAVDERVAAAATGRALAEAIAELPADPALPTFRAAGPQGTVVQSFATADTFVAAPGDR
jgi:hypothetical protein